MKIYTVKLRILHKWISYDDSEIEISAENEEKAILEAKKQAFEESDPDFYDVTLDESYLENIEIIKCKNLEIPRCNETIEMFETIKNKN